MGLRSVRRRRRENVTCGRIAERRGEFGVQTSTAEEEGLGESGTGEVDAVSAWEARKGGWISGSRRGGTKTAERPAPYGVHYTPVQCPQCYSLDIDKYSKVDATRYCKCRKCSFNFKAVPQYQFPVK
jgi:hypothetical protein